MKFNEFEERIVCFDKIDSTHKYLKGNYNFLDNKK